VGSLGVQAPAVDPAQPACLKTQQRLGLEQVSQGGEAIVGLSL
jgi:hypothetical protein